MEMQTETLRRCIEAGQRGGFARALLAFYDEQTFAALERVYAVADQANTAAVYRALQRSSHVGGHSRRALRSALIREFAGLAHLDETTTNPHAIILRTEPALLSAREAG